MKMMFFDPIDYAQYLHRLSDYSLMVERRVATKTHDRDIRITQLWLIAREYVSRDRRY